MFKRLTLPIGFLALAGVMLILSSCAVLTRSTEGSSETFANTSDAWTEVTSSTSPRDEDKDKDANALKVKRFAAANLDRLKEDMARGGGEHLAAFAYLLGIKESRQTEFFTVTRKNYPVLFSSEATTPEEMLARLDTELAAYPAWRQ